MGLNIEDFYEANERRRESRELELGSEWHDASGRRFELNYVVDTGEVYLMSAPEAELIEDPFGDIAVDNEPVEDLDVEVIAVVPTADLLHQALSGWEAKMPTPASTVWLREQLVDYPST
jgi:hypothetical protein